MKDRFPDILQAERVYSAASPTADLLVDAMLIVTGVQGLL